MGDTEKTKHDPVFTAGYLAGWEAARKAAAQAVVDRLTPLGGGKINEWARGWRNACERCEADIRILKPPVAENGIT